IGRNLVERFRPLGSRAWFIAKFARNTRAERSAQEIDWSPVRRFDDEIEAFPIPSRHVRVGQSDRHGALAQ
ncbi:hypothetical protein OVV29_39050, partial [Klebsiella pneumoniae]|nr:hypothetical protein [Klebsiella pneumoniae]